MLDCVGDVLALKTGLLLPDFTPLQLEIGFGIGVCARGGTQGWGLPGMTGFSMEPPTGGCMGVLESMVPDFTTPTRPVIES